MQVRSVTCAGKLRYRVEGSTAIFGEPFAKVDKDRFYTCRLDSPGRAKQAFGLQRGQVDEALRQMLGRRPMTSTSEGKPRRSCFPAGRQGRTKTCQPASPLPRAAIEDELCDDGRRTKCEGCGQTLSM